MPRPLHPAQKMARKYWLGLAIAWALGLFATAALPVPWVYVAVAAVLAFFLGYTILLGQLKPVLSGKVFVNSASFGLLIIIFVALAVAARNSEFAVLAGIGLGLLGGVVAFRSLNTRGRFVAPASLLGGAPQENPGQREL